MTQQDRDEQEALARRYREAAAGDAWHERASDDPAESEDDPTLAVTPEVPDVPLTDVAHPDPADSEDHDAPPSEKGPYYDKLMRGLEPGETTGE